MQSRTHIFTILSVDVDASNVEMKNRVDDVCVHSRKQSKSEQACAADANGKAAQTNENAFDESLSRHVGENVYRLRYTPNRYLIFPRALFARLLCVARVWVRVDAITFPISSNSMF